MRRIPPRQYDHRERERDRRPGLPLRGPAPPDQGHRVHLEVPGADHEDGGLEGAAQTQPRGLHVHYLQAEQGLLRQGSGSQV